MKLVCHRGILSTSPPMENTLDAFEMAWGVLGYTYCECDVVMTKDRTLIVHHDLTFARLLHPSLQTHPFAHTPISELTLPQIQAHIRLRNGLPPDTLLDLLECAQRLSLQLPHTPHKKIVLELKCAEQEYYVDTLIRLLMEERPDTLPYIALIMSFDIDLLNRLARAPRILPLFYLTEMFEVTEENMTQLLHRIAHLDGVYLQYQPEWHIVANLKRFVQKGFRVGVWNDTTQPDGRETRSTLPPFIQYVNTDIHLEETDA